MPQPHRAGRAACAVMAVLMVGAGASRAGLAADDAVSRLAGRWAGQGTVTSTRGPTESFKCVVNYLPGGDPRRVQQNLRCSNDTFKLDAATHLQFDGNRVSGRWEDKIHDLEGVVTGDLREDGFSILLAGRFFQATMDVKGNDCAQSVKVAPTRGGQDIREISAALRRC